MRERRESRRGAGHGEERRGRGCGDPGNPRGLHEQGELGQILHPEGHRRLLRVVRRLARPPRPSPCRALLLPRRGHPDPDSCPRMRQLPRLRVPLRRRVPARHQHRLLQGRRLRHAPPLRPLPPGDAVASHGHD